MRSASARGASPAGLASTMAALVARSPCEASFGGSSVTPSMLAVSRHDAVMLELLDRSEDAPVEPCKNVHGCSRMVSRD